MEYRNLGRTGVKVSPLCLGGMNFGNATPEDESIRIIHAAIDGGINFIDTANRYGEGGPYGYGGSEIIIGKALNQASKRNNVVLSTKVHFHMDETDPNGGGLSRRHILHEAENCLRRLDTDYIDLLQLHRDDKSLAMDEPMRALDDLVRSGKVRYIGSGFNEAWRFVESLAVSERLNLSRYVSVQPMVSLLVRGAERTLIPMARAHDVAVMAHSPLNGGFFTDRFNIDDRDTKGSRLQEWGWHETLEEESWEVLAETQFIAHEKTATTSQIATRWVIDQPGITTAIIGPRTMAHLEDLLGVMDITLTNEDLQHLDAVSSPRNNLWANQPRRKGRRKDTA